MPEKTQMQRQTLIMMHGKNSKPSYEDVEKWIAVREKFYSAQDRFEKLLWQALGR